MTDSIETARQIIGDLEDRSGFDHWWHEIDASVQEEIVQAIAKRIEEGADGE